jgi:hypothetical protein
MKRRILILATLIPLALMGIAMATSTMNPRITYTGNGIPDPSVGRVGDMYIDLDTNVLYVMGTDGWGIFAVLPTPVNGTNGLNGATWIVGDIAPIDDLGSNGDLYFNYVSLDIFHKVDGTWIYLTTIAGQQGPTGPQGPAGTNGTNGTDGKDGRNGSAWYNELVASMTADLGFDGDYYLFANGTVYYKIDGTWVYFTSFMGPQGPAGLQGETGPQGETGATGATGVTGATGAMGPTGPQGISGVDGLDGSEGNIGAKGSDAPWWVYIILSAAGGGIVGSGIVLVVRRRSQKRQQVS